MSRPAPIFQHHLIHDVLNVGWRPVACSSQATEENAMKHVQPPLDGEILPPEPRQPIWPADGEIRLDTGVVLLLLGLGFVLGGARTALAWSLCAVLS
jgi:hypothetical protein